MYTVLLTSRRTLLGRVSAYVAASVMTACGAALWQLSAVHLRPFSLASQSGLFGYPVIRYTAASEWLRFELVVLTVLLLVFAVRVMLMAFKRPQHWQLSEDRIVRRVGMRTDTWPVSAVSRVRIVHFAHNTYVRLELHTGRWLKLPPFADDAEARDLARHFEGRGLTASGRKP